MNKYKLSVLLFVVAFIASYIGLCFFVPAFRLKLSADPLTYFVESVKNAPLVKSGISLLISLVIASVPHCIKK